MKKITIVGAGRVGESTAQILARKECFSEIVLTDVREGVARGTALDIQESAPLFGFDTRVTGDEDPAAMRGSDVVVVTAGSPRTPGMSRADVLETNLSVVESVLEEVRKHAPDAVLVMVTNPVDILTFVAWRRLGWHRRRVVGLSGVLDAARMAAFIALETGFSTRNISAMVLGGHGDTMVPLPRFTTIHGIPVTHFVDEARMAAIVERTRSAGAEILALKKTGSANDSPAAAIAAMVGAMCRDRRRILPCVGILDGEYGQRGVAIGVPLVIGRGGAERVIEIPLRDGERHAFEASARGLREQLASITAQ